MEFIRGGIVVTKLFKGVLISLAFISIIGTTVNLTEHPASFMEEVEASSSEIVGPIYMEIGYSLPTVSKHLGRENAIRSRFPDGKEVLVYHLSDDPFQRMIRVELVHPSVPGAHIDTNHTRSRDFNFHVDGKIYRVNVGIFNDSYLYDEPDPQPNPEPEEKPEASKPKENQAPQESNESKETSPDSSSSSKKEASSPSTKETSKEEPESVSKTQSEGTGANNSESADVSQSESTLTDASNENLIGGESLEEVSEIDDTLQDGDTVLEEKEEVEADLVDEVIGDGNKTAEREVFRGSVQATPLPLDTPSEQPVEDEANSQKATAQAAVLTESAGEVTHSQDVGYLVIAITLIALSVTVGISYNRKPN